MALCNATPERSDASHNCGGEKMMTDRKRPWEPMKLTHAGDVAEVMKNDGGQAKSNVAADPGDIFKPPGQG